jgi:hypothetical protein
MSIHLVEAKLSRPGAVDMPVEVGNERGRVHAWKAAASTLISSVEGGAAHQVFEGQQAVALSRSKYWSGLIGVAAGQDQAQWAPGLLPISRNCVQQVEWPRGLEHVGVGLAEPTAPEAHQSLLIVEVVPGGVQTRLPSEWASSGPLRLVRSQQVIKMQGATKVKRVFHVQTGRR